MIRTDQIGAVPTALLRLLDQDGRVAPEGFMAAFKVKRRQFNEALKRLEIRGYAALNDSGHVHLTAAGLAACARGEVITGGPKGMVKVMPNTFRQRVWAAIRVQRGFTISTVAAAAARDGDGDPRDNATRYVCRLVQAGFVAELPQRQPGTAPSSNGFKQFLLRVNSGPKAPIWRESARTMFDPNTGKDVPCKAD
jgi:hypothetical protein